MGRHVIPSALSLNKFGMQLRTGLNGAEHPKGIIMKNPSEHLWQTAFQGTLRSYLAQSDMLAPKVKCTQQFPVWENREEKI